MKLTAVELHPSGSSASVALSFRDPGREDPYNVKAISGLDAETIIARYYGGLGSSAQKFYSLSLEKRNVVIKIGLNPRWNLEETYSGLRDDIYRLVAASRTGLVSLHLMNGEDVVAAASGFISRVEAPLFERTQEATITLDGIDMFLRALEDVVVDISAMNPNNTIINDLVSTAPHGLTMALAFVRAKASVKIHDPDDSSWFFEVTPAGGFLIGDVLHLSSEYNNKYIYIQRGANQIHLADKITSTSVWPILFHGQNKLMVDGVDVIGGIRNMNWSSITHRPTYWGV